MRLRTVVYVDGFNLYYRALKGTPYRWLNLHALAQATLKRQNTITAVKYFTARVSGKTDPDAPARQQVYLNALATVPTVEVFYGHFLTKTVQRPLAEPEPGKSKWVYVMQSEEKGSDVNLATHLVHDAWRQLFDVAVVLTNDTDLCEPMRIVRDELDKPVGLLSPVASCSAPLKKVATFVRHISKAHLAAAQFPASIPGPAGPIIKPSSW